MGPGLDTSPLTDIFPELQFFDTTDAVQFTTRIRDAEFVFGNKIRFTERLFQAAPRLRLIGLTATGVDNIDLRSASQHGVAVCNIRSYCTRSVAEHVFGVLLTHTHSLNHYIADVRAGAWQRAQNFCMLTHPVRELSAMTLGIVGYGEIGKGVATTARGFGMNVLISVRPGLTTAIDGRVTFAELLRRSDVISLHCPLNDQTENLFGADAFRQMKSDAILINTARGGLIDSAALTDALQSGQIGAAAVDVLPQEPPVNGDPLLDYKGDNLIVTPHIAWATNESRQGAINELAANVTAFLDGRERNRVE